MKKYTKLLSVLLACAMLLAIAIPVASVSAGDKAEFRVETVDADAGATNVQVKVFATADPHFGAVGFTFNFDPNKLVYKKWAWNPALNEQTLNGENNVSVINKENAATTGELVIAYTTTVQLGGYDGYYPVNESGDEFDYIGTLYFDVKAGIPSGLAEISVTIDKLAVNDPDDPSGTGTIDVLFETTNGGINVAGVAHEHSWSEWTVTKEATCTEAGSQERTCDCGEKETEEIAALGHDWADWTVTKEATCEEAGSRERVCNRCGEKETEEIAALGHDYQETDRVAATCTDAGSITYKCSKCDDVKTETVDALGHDFGEWTVETAATCKDAGKEVRKCSRCDATEEREIPVDPEAHVWNDGEVTKEATEEEEGEIVYTCTICGETKTEAIPKLAKEAVASGVEDGKEYDLKDGKVAPTWEPAEATATLNGEPYTAGTEIKEAGDYELVITNGDKTTTIKFKVTDSTSTGEKETGKDENAKTSDIAVAGVAIFALIASAAVVVITRKKRLA